MPRFGHPDDRSVWGSWQEFFVGPPTKCNLHYIDLEDHSVRETLEMWRKMIADAYLTSKGGKDGQRPSL
jgi:hypothetical protein